MKHRIRFNSLKCPSLLPCFIAASVLGLIITNGWLLYWAVVTTEYLAGKTFVLGSVNEEEFSDGTFLFLEFGEDFWVSGRICNSFSGQGVLTYGMLKVNPITATRRACPPGPLEQLDESLFGMQEEKMALSLKNSVLTLKQGDTTLIYHEITVD